MKQKQFGQKCARWAIHQAVESVSAESAGQFLAIPDSRSEGEGGGFCRTQTCKAPYYALCNCVRTTIQLLGSHDVSVFRYLGGSGTCSYFYYAPIVSVLYRSTAFTCSF